MNYEYLMQHISYHLHTIVRIFTGEYQVSKSFCALLNFRDKLVSSNILGYFMELQETITEPMLLALNGQIVYALVPAGGGYMMIGPLRLQIPVQLKYDVPNISIDNNWIETVPYCDFKDLIGDVLLACNLSRQACITESELLLYNCIDVAKEEETLEYFSNLVFQNREYQIRHNPYDQEFREFASIENGNLEQLKRSLEEDYPGTIGTLARNPLRQAQNRGIVVITLASRSAIRGGLAAEIAYSLSDSYIQKIEDCKDIPTVFHLFHSAEFQYAQLVKELNEHKAGMHQKDPSPHINRCKDYIFAHLHEKIYIQDIANQLQINVNYLSTLFHNGEKISITDFIRREKINLAKNLLIYSKYSYIEIASYLSFSSQSHLGKSFKQVTGCTLKQYREQYGVRNR